MNNHIKSYFIFSKNESKAIALILLLIAGFIALPYFFSVKKLPAQSNKELEEKLAIIQTKEDIDTAANTTDRKTKWSNNKSIAEADSKLPVHLFNFNPNTVSVDELKQFGLNSKTINTFIKYREKGGKFYKPEDLRKLYTLKKEDADRIIPYANIPAPSKPNYFEKKSYTHTASPQKIDINTAGINEWRQLPTLGNLAYRILKFREKLGGFISVEQIAETYYLPDSVFQSIKPFLSISSGPIHKLSINTATDSELEAHPYISKNIARNIVDYRTKNGAFKTLDELNKVPYIGNKAIEKMLPYLSL